MISRLLTRRTRKEGHRFRRTLKLKNILAIVAIVVFLPLIAGPVTAEAKGKDAPEPAVKNGTAKVGTGVGDLAPDFTARDYRGAEVKLSDYRGKVVLLDFWASWCGPCMRELPSIVRIKEKYPRDRFAIIGVSLDMERTLPRMKSVAQENGLDYPIPYDGKGWQNAVSTSYGIRSIPATFVLDAEGRIVARDKRGRELEGFLDRLLLPGKK